MAEQPTRVALAELPRILREIVTSLLEREPDIELVTLEDASSLADALAHSRVEILIVGADDPAAEEAFADLLLLGERLSLIVIGADARTGMLYEFMPVRRRLGELSPQRLLDVVRRQHAAAVAWECR